MNVGDDTSLHVMRLAGYLGPFHGHDGVATGRGATPTDTISGDFSMLYHNIAGCPFRYPAQFCGSSQRDWEAARNAYRRERQGYTTTSPHQRSQDAGRPPPGATLLWPIGVPFSEQAQYPLGVQVQRLDRQTWFECTSTTASP